MPAETNRNAATLLSERILGRKDFIELVSDLEKAVAELILLRKEAPSSLEERLFNGLRFADVLSQSSNWEHRRMAYLLISLFLDLGEREQLSGMSVAVLETVSSAVFAALGNFPALEKMEKTSHYSEFSIPSDRYISRRLKEELQRSEDGQRILTDAQFRIAARMRDAEIFSFSGPTSVGKSFVLKDFVKSEIKRGDVIRKNIVFVVPTNALVAQTARDLRAELSNMPSVNVATHPCQSSILLERFCSTVYVFTPERLIRYLNTTNQEVGILIVDEAQRIVATKDGRSPLFYYGILETIRKFNPKVIFSSPVLKNPEIFLDLFGRSDQQSMLVQETAVVQQRFYVDLVSKRASYFPASVGADEVPIDANKLFKFEPWEAIRFLSRGSKSLVYVNTPRKVVEFALSAKCEASKSIGARAQKLIERIADEIHPDYFLIDALKRGVAFHHGRIPVELRDELEALFKDPNSGVDYLVCTSTLLEGVNLPARNLFILTDKHGTGQAIKKLEFENLAGRAGRLTRDYKGNVFCLRLKASEWEGYRERISLSAPEPVSSFLLPSNRRNRKQYSDIEKVLARKPLPKRTAVEEELTERYAAILIVQHRSGQNSLLTKNFIELAKNSSETLKEVDQELKIDLEVLKRSPELDPMLQESVRRSLEKLESPISIQKSELIDFDSLLSVLAEVSRLYRWKDRESKGHGAMFRRNASKGEYWLRLKYWTLLVFKWVSGKPMNLVINESLSHHMRAGELWLPNFSGGKSAKPFVKEEFDPNSKVHINHVIDQTLKDMDQGVGYRIHYYLKNYYDLCVDVFGEENAGIDLSILLEFGSSDPVEIELQKLGYSRESARKLRQTDLPYLEVSEKGILVGIDEEAIFRDDTFDDAVKRETADIFAL